MNVLCMYIVKMTRIKMVINLYGMFIDINGYIKCRDGSMVQQQIANLSCRNNIRFEGSSPSLYAHKVLTKNLFTNSFIYNIIIKNWRGTQAVEESSLENY